jgi:hypothetical protein
MGEWRGVSDARLVEPQDDRPLPPRQAAFEPPCACRQVSARRARS